MYDVIVSGAGPAGCIAAKVLADAGYTVLLTEKCPVPREKSCSGILLEKSVGLIDAFFGKIPRSVLSTPHQIKGLRVTTEVGKRFTFERMGINVWRSLFDYWLVLEIMDAGAEFRGHTEVSGYREEADRVVVTLCDGTVSEESARILIGCDGAEGVSSAAYCAGLRQIISPRIRSVRRDPLISILSITICFYSRISLSTMHGAPSRMSTLSPVLRCMILKPSRSIAHGFSRI